MLEYDKKKTPEIFKLKKIQTLLGTWLHLVDTFTTKRTQDIIISSVLRYLRRHGVHCAAGRAHFVPRGKHLYQPRPQNKSKINVTVRSQSKGNKEHTETTCPSLFKRNTHTHTHNTDLSSRHMYASIRGTQKSKQQNILKSNPFTLQQDKKNTCRFWGVQYVPDIECHALLPCINNHYPGYPATSQTV